MQSSDQQPAGENRRENGEVGNEIEQASTPLYEFPAGGSPFQDAPQPASITRNLSEGDRIQEPPEEYVQQELIYPPPPSYYLNMPGPSARPPLPPRQGANGPATSYSPGPQGQFYPGGVQVPTFPPAQFPGMQQQPAIKRSRRWVWIIVSIFTVAILVSGVLCTWAFYNLFNATYQQATGSMNVVNDYFQHLQSQGYASAYNDLQISGLTEDDFIAKAQQSDAQYGTLLSFAVGQPTLPTNPGSTPDFSQWSITVNVTRAKSSYPVLLTVQKVGGDWKITYIDRY
jgi:hypothetical protein